MKTHEVIDADCMPLIGKKVEVTFFDKRVKVGTLHYKFYSELSKDAFEVDGQPFDSCYVERIDEVEE